VLTRLIAFRLVIALVLLERGGELVAELSDERIHVARRRLAHSARATVGTAAEAQHRLLTR
jgi:hypothetical protein